MVTLLIIIGCVILTIVGLAFYSINSRRPKFFRGDLKPFEKSLFAELENKLPQEVGQQSKRLTKLKYHSYEDETDIRDLGDNFLNVLETFLKIE